MTEYVTKAPAEERPFAVLYADLAPGETVIEDLGWTVVPDEMDALALAVASSTQAGATATAVLTGGRPGHLYHVANRVRTSEARVLTRGVLVRVTAG
ncbi:hypothetical protein [uncultured Albimonas sp.]|uniref:phage fiber-tail adaptor protein n=1 Tax=uncultured Albimonas sp. TaxID=1331701 RepID=UPI0030EB51F1|tara:strand:+ start:5481 stop:5771 length:291 start_codon:yes stop_codon:yes gene_type:complete